MILYKVTIGKEIKVVLHFGIGLVGSAFEQRIRQSFSTKVQLLTSLLKIDWSDSSKSSEIIRNFLESNESFISESTSLSILWTAGKIGFNGTQVSATKELDFFKTITSLVNAKCQKLTNKIYFILVSSSGGIYEGQIKINNVNNYSPQRPYGLLKVGQEEFCKLEFNTPVFVRLSSVYSKTNVSSRLGLIGTLLTNGLNNKVTTIIGNSATLRDYILDDDIANAIISIIVTQDDTRTHFFAAGKSISIASLIRIVEKVLHKKLYINYSYTTTNDLNMAYNEDIISNHFRSSNLQVNIKQLLLFLLR